MTWDRCPLVRATSGSIAAASSKWGQLLILPEVLLLLTMRVLIMENESLGRCLARPGSISQNQLESPSLFYVLNLSTAAARKQLLQLQLTESLPRKENNCGRLFFFSPQSHCQHLSWLLSILSHLSPPRTPPEVFKLLSALIRFTQKARPSRKTSRQLDAEFWWILRVERFQQPCKCFCCLSIAVLALAHKWSWCTFDYWLL